MACSTVRHMGSCTPPSRPACSRALASSNTTVAAVSKMSECTEISVNSVTSPSSPNTRPTTGTPIISALLNVLASARAAPRRLKPCHTSEAVYTMPNATK
jgi:hypothetical protein